MVGEGFQFGAGVGRNPLLFIFAGLPTYFVVVLTLGYSGMVGMAWVVLIAYVEPLTGPSRCWYVH